PDRAGPSLPPQVPIEANLPAADGSALPVTVWEAETPGAVILALHGYGDHGASTFSGAAAAWAAAGITTYAPDQRGFGRGATWGRWPGAPALIDDAVALSRAVAVEHPDLPLIVLGHSMGGGVVLAAADPARGDGGLAADALILAAPAIWGGDALNPLHRAAAWTAAAVVPERRFTGEGVVRIQASDNIEALRALARDPLYLSPPSAREILGLVRITDAAAAAAPRVITPSLMLLGTKDQIVPEENVRRVFESLAGPRRVVLYSEGWHLLFRDLQAAQVWSDIAAYALSQPLPATNY
ncbi:MAG: alpha/beta fold hydrolase, partial [Pseudomonadota bacterium]